MLAYTGYITRDYYLKLERERVAAAKRERRAHRSLNKQERLLKDLDRVHAECKQLEREAKRSRKVAHTFTITRRYQRKVRQWNRLVDLLNRVA